MFKFLKNLFKSAPPKKPFTFKDYINKTFIGFRVLKCWRDVYGDITPTSIEKKTGTITDGTEKSVQIDNEWYSYGNSPGCVYFSEIV